MKKPKLNINFGEGGFQGWLVRHCEKMILGVVILLALLVISRGYSLAGLGSDKTPDKLKSTADGKRTEITSTKWDDFGKTRQVALNTFEEVNKDSKESINSDPYGLERRWSSGNFRQWGRRKDPKILAPVNLKAVPMVTSLAYVAPMGYVDPLEGAVDDSKPVKRPAPKKPRAGAGMAGMEIPGAAGGGRKRGKGAQGPMGGMDGMEDLIGGAGEEMTGAMPGMEDGMGGMGGMGQTASSDMLIGQFRPPYNSMLKTRHAVVLMAVVPHKQQVEEYDSVFGQALDPDMNRDFPMYRGFFIQRADVTADPNADPATLDWQDVNREVLLDDWARWAGVPQDILDPAYLEYVDYESQVGLTYPLPPFVQRDLWEAMTHPDIPLASARGMQVPTEMPDEEPADEEGNKVPGRRVPGRGQRGPGFPGAGMMPGAGMPGMAGGGMPGMAGAGMPGAPGAGMPGAPGAGMPGMPGMPGAEEGAETPGMMPGMPGMAGMEMGMGGMGMGMMGMGMQGRGPQVKYKLIRFTDLTVQPGHKYRYQVQVLLDDPNNPASYDAPKPAALDPEVAARIQKDPEKTWLESDWSAPSGVVSVTSTQWFYAGKVIPDAVQEHVKGTRQVRQREAAATALAVVHDPTKGVDVPVLFDVIDQKDQRVIRGSTLNYKADVRVVHPVAGDFRKLKDYVLQTDAVVADILGGDDIPTLDTKVRDEKMTVPGELLIIDGEGNLIVRDESKDVEDFRRFVPPEEETSAAGQEEATPGGGFAPMDEGVPLPGEVPGGGGGRRRKGM